MKLVDVVFEADEKEATEAPVRELPDTAEVSQGAFPFLQKKIDKLNKRAGKNNLPPIKLEIIKEYMKKVKGESEMDFYPARTYDVPYYTVKVTGATPRIAGYKFIATVEHQGGGNIIRTVPGEEGNKKIKNFYNTKPDYCDHCKKVRRRNDTFIIKEEKSGKLRQIGRNCLSDFLPGIDPKALLAYFNGRDSIGRMAGEAEEEMGRKGGGGGGDRFVPLEEVLTIGAALVREMGFMSSKKAQEIGDGVPTTASDVRWFLFARKTKDDLKNKRFEKIYQLGGAPTAADKKQAEDILKWFETVPEQQKQSNEFMHNLSVIVKSGQVNPRNIGFAMALFPVYARAMDQIKQKVNAPQKSNEWLGKVGDKLPPTKVKVIRTRLIQNQFGYAGGSTQIVAMEDEKGNQLTWFNNSANRMEDGAEYTITGTVKKHDEFNGKRQTHVMRVKTI